MSTLWDHRAEGRPFFSVLLRPIGLFLDGQSARAIHVVESPDGFSVRFTAGSDAEPRVTDFTWEELARQQNALQGSRREPPPDESGDQVFQAPERTYQHLLRALGFELDQLRAYSIAIDEIEQQFLLTYSYQDPARGLSWHKRMALVGPEEQDTFLRDAESRRSPLETRRRLWFR